jgi:hypothetical protein
LIIPDINAAAGTVNSITGLLGNNGISQIQSFVATGGSLYAAANGAVLATSLGVLPAGSFAPDTSTTRSTLRASSGLSTSILGCSDSDTDPDRDWIRHALCFSAPVNDASLPQGGIVLAPVYIGSDPTVQVVAYLNNSLLQIRSGTNNYQAVSPSDQTVYPYLLSYKYKQGQVIVTTGSAVSDPSFFPWFYNALWLSLSRPLMVDSALVSSYSVIPALEQVSLSVSINVTNLYSENLVNGSLLVYVANGINLVSYPSQCSIITPPAGATATVPAALNTSYTLDCTPSGNTFVAFSKLELNINIFIWNVSITQQGSGIVLLYPTISYVIPSRNNDAIKYDYGAITANAFTAALLATDINADPMGIYPVLGKGNNIDNVQFVQNKAQTVALNVKQVSFVPLVTPFVDGSNQAKLTHVIDYDYAYYLKAINTNADYVYPFVHPTQPYASDPLRDSDYVDYLRLLERGNTIVVDWDTPVESTTVARDPTVFGTLPPASGSVPGSQVTTNANGLQTVMQQSYFPDANIFFEHASQRNQAYFDLTDPYAWGNYTQVVTGVPSAFTGTGIPSWRVNSRGTAMRANLAFGRQDIYWYQNLPAETPLPVGVVSVNQTITIDRYVPPTSPACVAGNAGPTKAVPGYFSSSIQTASDADHPPGLAPNQYTNTWLDNCDRRNNVIKIYDNNLPAGVELSHYLVRLPYNPELQTGDDALYFIADSNATNEWYYAPDTTLANAGATLQTSVKYGDYPEIRLKYVFGADFAVAPNISQQGARVNLILPTGVQPTIPFDPDTVTWSADFVTFVSTVYNAATNTITSVFKRGLMPNESNGLPSQLQVNLENLQGASSGTITVQLTLEQLFYDISGANNPDPFQSYGSPMTQPPLIFTNQLMLSLPAAKLTYELVRSNNATGLNGSYILPLESISPLVRQGNFLQELRTHSTVYASVENHPISDTGIVVNSGGPSWITNIGTSSIPFKNFLVCTVGSTVSQIHCSSRQPDRNK